MSTEARDEDSEFAVLLETVPVGVFIAHDPECRKISANRIALEMLRLPQGSNVSQSAPKDQLPAFRTYRDGTVVSPEQLPMQKAIATGQAVWNHEDTLRFEDGREVILLINARPLFDGAGKVRGGIATCLDVTQQKYSLRELESARERLREKADDLEKRVEERTEELKKTIRDLESFSYTVSHDLRTPLRAMQSYAQSVLEDFSSNLPVEVIRRLERVDRAAQKLDRLVQEVLTYSRMARQKVDLEPVDPNVVLAEVLEMFPEFGAKAENIEIMAPLRVVLAQETLLSQCLSNLIYNAFKFVPKNTVAKIRIFTSTSNNGKVRLSVRDNGIGIDPAHHERIFEIFGRVYAEDVYSGTGIGLAIVKKAMEQMGGTAGVESALDQGSTFWLEFQDVEHE